MTLKQLAQLYNFHDCYVFTPFEIDGESVTVTFDLAKHLQYDDLKARYGDMLQKKECHLIVRVKFSDCLNFQICELTPHFTGAKKQSFTSDARIISMEQFDTQADFISVSLADSDSICFVFESIDSFKKIIEIQFESEQIEVLEEGVLDAVEFVKLWKQFE